METSARSSPRREGAVAVHSLHRFVFTVPDLDVAAAFYADFGLDVRRTGGRLDLHTFGHEHRWGSIYEAHGPKRLQYVSFGAYADDYDRIAERVKGLGIAGTGPHPLADEDGDVVRRSRRHAGAACRRRARLLLRKRSSRPLARAWQAAAPHRHGQRPARSGRGGSRTSCCSAPTCRDRCGSIRTRSGCGLSDHSGEIIAFLHGAHASDHHLIAFAKSDGAGLHHSSWDVATFDEVGLGMQQMIDRGHAHGWGVGRHVLGSNYFRYIRDPWGSFAEYSYDIDFIPATIDWQAKDHPPEDSFYVWGPPVPDDFIINHETARRPS
jgi:hypothetical protein